MSQQFLDGTDVGSGLEQVCGKTVAKRVATRLFRDSRVENRVVYRLLWGIFVNVVSPSYRIGV